MPKIIVLGTANAIPDENHENTYLAVVGDERKIMIDCAGSPVVRLGQAGIPINSVTDLFLTHFHPDHISGVPSLLMSMWLLGRQEPLDIYGLPYTLDRVERMMSLFEWDQWPGFFPVSFHPLSEEPLTLALQTKEFRLFTSPVNHLLPTIGLRIESKETRGVVAYSCDTEPCDAVVELADRADILFHEATGKHHGHSSASQAGHIAARARAGSLYLIHYDPQNENLENHAQSSFPGPVYIAKDFQTIEF